MDYGIKIRIKLNNNGVVELSETSMIEKYKVEEKVLKPKTGDKKEGEKEEDEYEIKMKEKTRHTDLKSDVSSLYIIV